MTEIRRATPADAAVCAHIQTASWKAAFDGIVPAGELARATDEPRVLEMYERALARPEMHGLILSIDGAPHCMAFWSKSRDDDADGQAELICIHSLPANWRRGYGTLMMEHALVNMRTAGFKSVMLWVFERNTRARKFYEKCGYALTGRSREELRAIAVQYEIKL